MWPAWNIRKTFKHSYLFCNDFTESAFVGLPECLGLIKATFGK